MPSSSAVVRSSLMSSFPWKQTRAGNVTPVDQRSDTKTRALIKEPRDSLLTRRQANSGSEAGTRGTHHAACAPHTHAHTRLTPAQCASSQCICFTHALVVDRTFTFSLPSTHTLVLAIATPLVRRATRAFVSFASISIF